MSDAEDAGKYSIENQESPIGQQNNGDHNTNTQIIIGTQNNFYVLDGKPIPSLSVPSSGLPPSTVEASESSSQNRAGIVQYDWGEAPDVLTFFGRTKELLLLKQWLSSDRCRLVAIVGMGGIGKTGISLKFARGLEQQFDYVIWRGLLNAPKVSEILIDLIKFLSNQQEVHLPVPVSEQIPRLLHYLRKSRCLVILDNVERILQGGHYLPGYEGYGQLFEHLATVSHQSCVLLTSREKTSEIARLESKTGSVRLLELSLDVADGKKIFAELDSFSGSKEDWKQLNRLYNGNPLALDLVARHIKEVFFRDISTFLKEGKSLFGNLYHLLDWHFNRLSDSHKEIMYWFAINREPIPRSELKEDLLSVRGKEHFTSTLESLQNLIPLEKSTNSFTLQPVLIEYMTERLVEQVVEEVRNEEIHLFHTHALLKTSVSDYVRESQRRVILQPISNRLLEIYKNQEGLEGRLKALLSLLQERFRYEPGYAGGNLLNLLCFLNVDLRGYNFSSLAIWHAYLRGMNLHSVNFTRANLMKPMFTDTFGNPLCVALSKYKDLLAVGTATGEIRLWDIKEGLPVQTFRNHTDWIRSIAFSPDGKTLISGSDDQTVCVWEVSSGKLLNTLRGHTDVVYTVTFSPDERTLASGSGDRTIRLWEVSSGKLLNTLQGHTDWVYVLAFSPDGRTLASGSRDRTIRLWEVSSGKWLNTLQGHTDWVRSVDFSPDGRTLASGSSDRTVRLWKMSNGQCFNTLQGHANWIRSVAFSPDGKVLVSASDDQMVRLWEVSNGQCFNTLQGYANWIRSVAFSLDGRMLASAGDDHMVYLWNMSNFSLLNILRSHTDTVFAVAFSPDKKTLASGSSDQTIRLWEASSGTLLNTLRSHSYSIYAVAFSPDGSLLASGSGDDQMVRLWEVSSGKLLKKLEGHTDWVKSVAFSPDGNILASGSRDRTVRLWKVNSGQYITLQDHDYWVYTVAFSPDESILASGDDDGAIIIWNSQIGVRLHTLRSDRPYERMNIANVNGLTGAQKATLRSLCAVEDDQPEQF